MIACISQLFMVGHYVCIKHLAYLVAGCSAGCRTKSKSQCLYVTAFPAVGQDPHCGGLVDLQRLVPVLPGQREDSSRPWE